MNFLVYQSIYFYDITTIFFGISFFVVTIYFLRLLIGVVVINDKIEKLYGLRDEEIRDRTSNQGIILPIVEAITKDITDRYDKKIKPLERRKSYIFDIIPFIPKK